jgi:hypothetical protein
MMVLVAGNEISFDRFPRREQGLDLPLHDLLAESFAREGLQCRQVHIEPHELHRCSVEVHLVDEGNSGTADPTVKRLDHDEIVARLSQHHAPEGDDISVEVFYHAGMYWVLFDV